MGSAPPSPGRRSNFSSDGRAKAVCIWSQVGRRPILAAGNAKGDIAMLTSAAHLSRPSLGLLVSHDDAREIAFIARAEKALELANERGRVVASVTDDRATAFDTPWGSPCVRTPALPR